MAPRSKTTTENHDELMAAHNLEIRVFDPHRVGTIAGLGLLTAIGLQVSWWIAVPAAIIGLGLVFGRD